MDHASLGLTEWTDYDSQGLPFQVASLPPGTQWAARPPEGATSHVTPEGDRIWANGYALQKYGTTVCKTWYPHPDVLHPYGPNGILDTSGSSFPFPAGKSSLEWSTEERASAWRKGLAKGLTPSFIEKCGPCIAFNEANPSLAAISCRSNAVNTNTVDGEPSCSQCANYGISGCRMSLIAKRQAECAKYLRTERDQAARKAKPAQAGSSRGQ